MTSGKVERVIVKLPPLIALLAVVLLFFKLPEIQRILGFACPVCNRLDPFIPMLGGAYFSFVAAALYHFSFFSKKIVARIFLLFAITLALGMTFISPKWCLICLTVHILHCSLWSIKVFFPKKSWPVVSDELMKVKVSILVLAVFSSLAAMGSVNNVFLSYEIPKWENAHKPLPSVSSINWKEFKKLYPIVNSDTSGVVVSFVSPTCHFCKSHLELMGKISPEYMKRGFAFLRVVDGVNSSKNVVLDPDRLGIKQLPTVLIFNNQGQVVRRLEGAAPDLDANLTSTLEYLARSNG